MDSQITQVELRQLLVQLYGDGDLVHALLRYGGLRFFRPSRPLACQGDPANAAYLVLFGRFTCHKYRSDDSLTPLPSLNKGAWLGLAECVSKASYLYEAIAGEACAVLEFTVLNFASLRRHVPSFDSLVLVPALSQDLYSLHAQLADASPLDRLVSYLLGQRRSIGGVAKQSISITQAELGRAIGCTRETVNKYLNVLENRGLITLERSCVVVPSWESLANYQ